MVNIRSILLSVISLLMFSSGNHPLDATPKSELSGTITDALGSRVLGAHIYFRTGQVEAEVQSSSDGTYSIRLVPGVYSVEVKSPGFCAMRRSQLALRANAVVQIDFELLVCAFDSLTRPYAEEELPAIGDSTIRPLVQFGCRKEHGAIEYTGLVQQGIYVRPVLTYDSWTLRANSLRYDQSTKVLAAEGNVIWQDGKNTKIAKYIQIILRDPLEVTRIVL